MKENRLFQGGWQAHAALLMSASELAQRITQGELAASEVVEAHIEQIQRVNGDLNAVVLPRFEEARREAAAVDEVRRKGGPLGPLAGVPVTVKECFHVQGMPATIGVVGFDAGRKADADGPLVARLRAAGAIVLGKTNVPQLMSLNETVNPVYGRTNNPWDFRRTPGGSSGGEAAIIAAHGSPLGLGNDLGGSIRVPAHFCGVHGLKPTTGRLTNLGAVANFRGLTAMSTQPGPLARHVADLELAMRILSSEEDACVDPQTAPVPTAEEPDDGVLGLRGAMWTDDGYFTPSPAVCRAVAEAADALRAAGAIVNAVPPPDMQEAMELFMALFTADGGADLRRLLGDSPREPLIRRMLLTLRVPRWLRPAVCGILARLGLPREAHVLRSAGPYSADRHWQHSYRRQLLATGFSKRLAADGYDFILCPTYAVPAFQHGASVDLAPAGSYAMLFNLLGMPAGSVAVTRVKASEEHALRPGRAPSDRRARDAETDSAGLPIGVQVAAPWWQEQRVLSVMRVIERASAKNPDYAATAHPRTGTS